MSTRARLASSFLRVGDVLNDLPVAVMRPEDMTEWARVRYDRSSKSLTALNDPDDGLVEDEAELWTRAATSFDGLPGRVLVLGGGGGREAVAFARKGWRVTALDVADGMLEEARAATKVRGLELRTVCADLATYDVPRAAYDLIWTSMFLYSLVMGRARRVAMLRRMGRALRPSGRFVVSFHFDPRARVGERRDRLRRRVAAISGNSGYQNGDILFGTLEFRHAFVSEEEVRAEFEAGCFSVEHLSLSERLMRGGAVLMKREAGGP